MERWGAGAGKGIDWGGFCSSWLRMRLGLASWARGFMLLSIFLIGWFNATAAIMKHSCMFAFLTPLSVCHKVKTGWMYEGYVERRQVQQDLSIMHMAKWVL